MSVLNPDRARRALRNAGSSSHRSAGSSSHRNCRRPRASCDSPSSDNISGVPELAVCGGAGTSHRHSARAYQQKVQNAGWQPDIERWESDEDSDGSDEEDDHAERLELSPDSIRRLCM